jgi:hypothetical protein
MSDRRQFLTAGGAVAALTLIGSQSLVRSASATVPDTVDPVAPPADSTGMAGMPGMDHSAAPVGGVTRSFRHRGAKVDVTVSDSMAMATVDGRTKVHIERWSATQFHSHGLPFQIYSDPTQLVKALLDAQAAQLIIL